MATFINLDLEKPIHRKFLLKHILFASIWILGLIIFIFRIDFNLTNYLSEQYYWIIKIIPFIFIGLIILLMFLSKWYYNLALLTYPFLIIFWFLPKKILHKGKIYLFSNYISFIFNRFKQFKKTIFHVGLFILTIFVLAISDSNIVRILSMLIISYFYYRYVIGYIKASFRPAQLFGPKIEKFIDNYIHSPEKRFDFVKSLDEDKKKEEVLSDEEKRKKRLERLIIINYLIETFGNNLNGFKGKRAFIISWLYQLIGFLIISLTFFTFLNFELFIIDKSNFSVQGVPDLFDFFYYTLKAIAFNNIELIIPNSIIARVIEIFTFFTLGIFLLIFVTSIIFTIRQDRINENVKKATELCLYQNNAIVEHISLNYQTDIKTVLIEMKNIKNSLEEIKKIIGSLF